jgi:hypothetical protein
MKAKGDCPDQVHSDQVVWDSQAGVGLREQSSD